MSLSRLMIGVFVSSLWNFKSPCEFWLMVFMCLLHIVPATLKLTFSFYSHSSFSTSQLFSFMRLAFYIVLLKIITMHF